MSIRELLPPADENNGSENSTQSVAQPAKTRKTRATKNKASEGAIAKTKGHDLVDKQRSNAAEFTGGLEHQEEVLTAYGGYQRGKKLAHIKRAAQTAGIVDTLAEQTLDSIKSLEELLEQNAEGFDPVGFVADLGLNMTGEESDEMRAKIAEFSSKDYSRFLP